MVQWTRCGTRVLLLVLMLAFWLPRVDSLSMDFRLDDGHDGGVTSFAPLTMEVGTAMAVLKLQ